MLTEESRHHDFPALADMAYLNTAAESIPPVSVHEALAQYARDKGLGMRGRVPHNETMEACREVAAHGRSANGGSIILLAVPKRTISSPTPCTSGRTMKR